MFGVCQISNLSDKIFDCLLTAVAKMQFVDRSASFLFVDDVSTHHEEWLRSSMTNLHGRPARVFALSLGCERIVMKPTHIDGGVLDPVLTDFSDVVGVWIGTSFGTSNHNAVYIDVVLEQTIPCLVWGQEVHLKNCELVRGDVTGLNWNGISRTSCPVSPLNEAFLRAIKDTIFKRTIVVRTRDKPLFEDRCIFACRAKQRASRTVIPKVGVHVPLNNTKFGTMVFTK